MLPFTKAEWFIGYSNLAMIMEQDRRHWLMKTDKKKEIHNPQDGSVFTGYLDNQGLHIDISTQKDGTMDVVLPDKLPEGLDQVFELVLSALPYSYEVNGFYDARIISTQYPHSSGNKNFKIRFENCTEYRIPFTGANGANIFAYSFIKTTTKPKLMMIDGNGNYTIEVPVDIDITNAVFYYPLDTFQPIDLNNLGNGVYETILIDDDSYIGYPAFWFTCDETNTGPEFEITDVISVEYGNVKDNMYDPRIFIMDQMYESGSKYIRVYPAEGYSFSNSTADFDVPVNMSRVNLMTPQGLSPILVENIPITASDNTKLFITGADWRFRDAEGGVYEVGLSSYNPNYTTPSAALIPAFIIKFDHSIPFRQSTKDTGYAGVDVSSDAKSSPFPFNLNQWDGLPEWMAENNGASQRVIVYAIHDTPSSSPEVPMSRQTAALILDPGKQVNVASAELSEDEKGRVYVLSNDDAVYANNALAEYPKPARTLARMCDIPVSVMQLSNISGIAPTPIVDPKYVRSESSYSEAEEERLYNVLNDRWVRPTAIKAGAISHEDVVSIYDFYEDETNEFIFQNPEHLAEVDLMNYNDFRVHTQLNEFVQPEEVTLYLIANGGSGYALNDIGTVVIGGFAFDYIVGEVDADGKVTQATIAPSGNYPIHISNFDMADGSSGGITKPYGTSPRGDSTGTGLKLQFQIQNYQSKIPSRGEVYDGLYAFVNETGGLWMYQYNKGTFTWDKTIQIAEYEVTTPKHVSTKDSYIRSILPNVETLPVAYKKSGVKETTLQTITTSTFVNIVDTTLTPIYDMKTANTNVIDINKFYCHRIRRARAASKRFDSILQKIKFLNDDRFDSYIIWRWVSDNPSDFNFEYGIVHRSFNNLQSTDITSSLPINELPTQNYINTNASTTIAWDVKDFGSMIWVFNPRSNVRETYTINSQSRDLNIERQNLTWKDIEVYTDNFQTKVDMVDSSGKLLWNIASNVPSTTRVSETPIYQQPDYTSNIAIGTIAQNISPDNQPRGTWQLVFPRVQTYHFRNATNGAEYTPLRLGVIRGINVQPNTDVLDSYGNPVNYKTLIVDSTDSNASSIKVYNDSTGEWNKI